MTQIILMYVYFDKLNDIKAITPVVDAELEKDHGHALIPISDVEKFLVGQANPFDYTVKQTQKLGGKSYSIVKKYSAITITRSLDSYVTKIVESSDNAIIRLVTDLSRKTVSLAINQDFKRLQYEGNDEEQESVIDFLETGPSTIYITKRNNPYSLLFNMSFVPKDLFDRGRITFQYPETLDLRNTSAYTKRLVNSYKYMIRGEHGI